MLRVREHWPARCCVLFSTVVPLGNYRAQASCSLTQSSTQPPCALTPSLPHFFSFFLLFLLHAGFSKSGQVRGGVIAAASRAEIPRDETCRNTLVMNPRMHVENTPPPRPPRRLVSGEKSKTGKSTLREREERPGQAGASGLAWVSQVMWLNIRCFVLSYSQNRGGGKGDYY